MMFNQFIARLAPFFAGLGLVSSFAPIRAEQETGYDSGKNFGRRKKMSLRSQSRQEKHLYARRLTRSMENYAKTHE